MDMGIKGSNNEPQGTNKMALLDARAGITIVRTARDNEPGDGSAAHSRRWRHSKPNLPSGTGFLPPETSAPKAP
jgi:hypothetical protein